MSLVIEDLSIGAGTKHILGPVSFSLLGAKTLALMGPSGSGKSMLVRTILGLNSALHLSGRIHFFGHLIQDNQKNFGPLSKGAFAYVPQNLSLWPHCSVQKTLELTRSFSQEEGLMSIQEMLSFLSLSSLKNRLPHELSRGEQQRLAIGRALINKPKFLVLDEPFSALDIITRQHLLQLLKELLLRMTTSVIFITHDLSETRFLSDDLMILYAGKKLWHGPLHNFKDEPQEWPLLRAHKFFYAPY